jgi:hypothetical protein
VKTVIRLAGWAATMSLTSVLLGSDRCGKFVVRAFEDKFLKLDIYLVSK